MGIVSSIAVVAFSSNWADYILYVQLLFAVVNTFSLNIFEWNQRERMQKNGPKKAHRSKPTLWTHAKYLLLFSVDHVFDRSIFCAVNEITRALTKFTETGNVYAFDWRKIGMSNNWFYLNFNPIQPNTKRTRSTIEKKTLFRLLPQIHNLIYLVVFMLRRLN